jgi:molybdate transport system substrate-binding protein
MTTTTTHRRRPGALAAGLALALVAGASCGGGSGGDAGDAGDAAAAGRALEGTATVFAAASLTDALLDAEAAFSRAHPGAAVELNFAGSASLREQILAGAPADVYAPADMANIDRVAEAGELAGPPHVIARNALEIAVPAGNPAAVDGLADLGDASLLIGLCAADVPCGRLGRRVLANAGVTPAPDTDEPDVRSLLTKIEAAELDAGIVYRTDVRSAGGRVDGIAIDDADNVVTDYPVAVLARAGEPAVAAAFVEFLLSSAGQSILASHGFGPA